MTDNSVLTENKIARTRDFATVTGFMVIFIYTTILVACMAKNLVILEVYGENKLFLTLVPFMVLVFAAGILAWSKDRYLVAAMFIMFGYGMLAPMFPVVIFGEEVMSTLAVGIVMIIFALALISARRKQDFLCAIILILMGATCIIYDYWNDISFAKELAMSFCIVITIIAAYCIFSYSIGSTKLPGYRFFTGSGGFENQEDFRETSVALGFMIMSVSMLASSLHYLSIGDITPNQMAGMETATGVTLLILSVIMILTIHSKFMPFLFLMLGVTMTLTAFITEIGQVLCVFMLLIGLICFVRNDGKTMAGIAIILYGFTYLISAQFVDNGNAMLSSVLNIIPCLIMFYLTFAYLSEKELPIA